MIDIHHFSKNLDALKEQIRKRLSDMIQKDWDWITKDDVIDGWKLPTASYNKVIQTLKKNGIDPGREEIIEVIPKKMKSKKSKDDGVYKYGAEPVIRAVAQKIIGQGSTNNKVKNVADFSSLSFEKSFFDMINRIDRIRF